jgi:hypothetical protein
MPLVMPSDRASASPLSRMVAAMRVKSPFSQSALFGLIADDDMSGVFSFERQF